MKTSRLLGRFKLASRNLSVTDYVFIYGIILTAFSAEAKPASDQKNEAKVDMESGNWSVITCGEMYDKPPEEIAQMTQTCRKKTGGFAPNINDTKQIIINYNNKIVEDDYDDKCFMKCILENLSMLKNGEFTVDNLSGHLNPKLPKKIVETLTDIWRTCYKEIENMKFKTDTNEEAMTCKKAAALDICYLEKTLKTKFDC